MLDFLVIVVVIFVFLIFVFLIFFSLVWIGERQRFSKLSKTVSFQLVQACRQAQDDSQAGTKYEQMMHCAHFWVVRVVFIFLIFIFTVIIVIFFIFFIFFVIFLLLPNWVMQKVGEQRRFD